MRSDDEESCFDNNNSNNSTDPIDLHNTWSKLQYGEEYASRCQISPQVALQLPCWTSQLRLALQNDQFTSLLLPHIWIKVQQQVIVDDFVHANTQKWKEDYMIVHWHLTRFHMLRESRHAVEQFRLVCQIMDRIDEYYYSDYNNDDRSSNARKRRRKRPTIILGSSSNTQSGKSLRIILSDYMTDYFEEQQREKQRQDNNNATVTTTISPVFINWVAEQQQQQQPQQEIGTNGEFDTNLRQLCRKIVGGRRDFLKKVKDQMENLPLFRMATGLASMTGHVEDERQGRALLAGLLQHSSHHRIPGLNPLPPALILWNDTDYDLLELLVDNYLSSTALPNVNSLVILLWSHRYIKRKWASWLPVDPIVPLVVNELHDQNDEIMQSAIDFLLALHWDDHHVQTALEPLLGETVPLEALALKQACTDALRILASKNKTTASNNKKRSKSTATNRNAVIHKMGWGTTLSEYPNDFSTDNAIDQDDYDYVDESDDRILLL